MKKRILRYMELRNDLVHYKWIGLKPAELKAGFTELRTVVNNTTFIIRYLRRLEKQVTTLKLRPGIRALPGLRGSKAAVRLSRTTV